MREYILLAVRRDHRRLQGPTALGAVRAPEKAPVWAERPADIADPVLIREDVDAVAVLVDADVAACTENDLVLLGEITIIADLA